MNISRENVGHFIAKNPDQPLMLKHKNGSFTFHNVSVGSALWFALKSTFQNFNARKDLPFMHRVMAQYNPQHETPTGSEVSPNSNPPKGMGIGWNAERGYHYKKQSEDLTPNQGIKETNLMPKEGDE